MGGNSIHRFRNTAVLAVCAIDAPLVVSSAEMDDRLADVYTRVGLRPGMMQRLAGIHERRWWNRGTSFADGAVMAGAKAMAEAGVQPGDIGLLVNTSVSRAHLEPSTAVAIHHALGLPSSCQNFDVSNACLGFVNGMQLAAAMLESWQIDYALVVNGRTPGASTTPPSAGCRTATATRRTSSRSSPHSPSVPAPRRWCWAGPTRTPRGTASSAARPGPGASTTCCASATWTTCTPTAPG